MLILAYICLLLLLLLLCLYLLILNLLSNAILATTESVYFRSFNLIWENGFLYNLTNSMYKSQSF